MDVVKKFIDKLQGKIDISSKPGLGSTFYIRLPLTLAIIEGITVRVGESIYILPTVAIREMFKPQRSAYHAIQNQAEIIEIRGEHLPLIRLYEIFGIVPEKTEPLESLVIVLENEGERRCIMVDEILGKQEAVIKNLGETLREIKGVAGGTILSNGRVGLILDAAGLFEAADNFRRVQIEAAERAWLNKQQIMQATVRPL